MKPIKLKRLIRAVNEVVDQLAKLVVSKESQDTLNNHTIFIKEDQVNYKIDLNEILFSEAYGNYLKMHTPGKVTLPVKLCAIWKIN